LNLALYLLDLVWNEAGVKFEPVPCHSTFGVVYFNPRLESLIVDKERAMASIVRNTADTWHEDIHLFIWIGGIRES